MENDSYWSSGSCQNIWERFFLKKMFWVIFYEDMTISLRRWENICGDIIQFGILCQIRAAPVLIKVWYDVVKI